MGIPLPELRVQERCFNDRWNVFLIFDPQEFKTNANVKFKCKTVKVKQTKLCACVFMVICIHDTTERINIMPTAEDIYVNLNL